MTNRMYIYDYVNRTAMNELAVEDTGAAELRAISPYRKVRNRSALRRMLDLLRAR